MTCERLRRDCGVEAGCEEVLRLAAKRVDVEVGCKEAGMLGWLQYAEIEAGKPSERHSTKH